MEYLTERSEGVPCGKSKCPWFNKNYEQNCQAEFNGEPHLANCVDYAPNTETWIDGHNQQ